MAVTPHICPHICIDATAAVSGGRVYLEHLLPRLARLDSISHFTVFHAADGRWIRDGLPADRFTFHEVTFPNTGASVLKMLWRLCVLPLTLYRLQPDVFFSNAGFLPLWMPLTTHTVVAIHNLMPLREDLFAVESGAEQWRLRVLRYLTGDAVRNCDGVVVFSAETTRQLERCFGELAVQPVVAWHGVEWPRSATDQGETVTTVELPTRYLLFVSHLYRYKNVVRLIEAFAQIASKHPDLSLLLVGEIGDSDYFAEVMAAIERLSLRGRVRHLTGCRRDELVGIYRRAVALAQPSLAETFSLPVAEALSLGVPVVAAKASALPEIAGEAAVWFDPEDVDSIARALRQVVEDPELRARLSDAGRRQAQHFSWDNSAQVTLDLLTRLTG